MMDSSISDALNIFKKNYEKYNDPVFNIYGWIYK